MMHNTIDIPRSEQFDDVYFSAVDGLAETRHVFLDGNDLPAAWEGKDSFTICETGFGTGLNFLAVCQDWLRTEQDIRPKTLRFISFEKYPLSKEYIYKHLSHWEDLSYPLEIFLSNYTADNKLKRIEMDIFDGVSLVVYVGDINNTIASIEERVNCWFLDGFKPSSNPDMWSEKVFQNMARLSTFNTSFATYTAAGFVRRGLEAVGFDVCKVPGFGRKREMCVGKFIQENTNAG